MFACANIVLIVLVASVSYGRTATTDRSCVHDTIDFASKIDKSTVVVYGKTMAKTINEESESTFHVFFQVDCILKGPATLRQINITNAGKMTKNTAT
jgi:hypothetical protein